MKNSFASHLASRRSAATGRAIAGAFDGSGAPTRRHRPALLLAALIVSALALFALAPAAFAAKSIDRFIGGQNGGFGGQFNGPADIAVNESGVGGATAGDTYVVDRLNHRVQVFDASGSFKFALGRDVIAAGATGDSGGVPEKCTVAEDCKAGLPSGAGGGFSEPLGIAVDQATGDVFVQDSANRRVQQLSAGGDFIRAWGFDVVQPGGTGNTVVLANEKQTVTLTGVSIFPVSGGTFTLGFGGQTTEPIAWNASAAALDSALEALSTVGAGNVNVSGSSPWTVEFTGPLGDADIEQMTADGSKLTTPFPGFFGSAAVSTSLQGGPQPVFEVCTAVFECKAGVAGSGSGQLAAGAHGIDIAPAGAPNAGNVLVADPGNRRAQEFDPTQPAAGMFVRTIGGSAQFEISMPRHVAVDSAGVLYAQNTANDSRINRFDATGTPMTPIASPPLLPGGNNEEVTSGLEVDPDSDGAGADVDRLYVLRNPAPGNTVVQQFDQPGLVAPPAAVTETHMPTEFGTASASGLGIDTASGDIYLSSSAGEAGPGYYALDDDGAGGSSISAQIESASDVTATSATLNGSVDPDNGFTSYQFEYNADGASWVTLLRSSVSGSGPQQASRGVSGLSPSTLYRVRLVAIKVLGPNNVVTDTSTETLLLTAPAKPTVATRPVSAYEDTSAVLVGEVNPNNDSTTYRFEWGKTASYGNNIPFPDANAGSGASTKTVLQKLTGLEPDTTYHYRIVAGSDVGTSHGADMTFTTRPAFEGFPGRAYEQVTPVVKIQGLSVSPHAVPAATDGSGIPFVAPYVLGSPVGSASAGHNWPFVSRRIDGKWETEIATPRRSDQGADAGLHALAGPGLPSGLIATSVPWEHQPDSAGSWIMHYPSGTQTFVAPYDGEAGEPGGNPGYHAAADDLGRVVFSSSLNLTGDPGIPGDTVAKLYEWVDGQVRLVSRDEAGVPLSTATRAGRTGASRSQTNLLSSDGRHIFFTNPALDTEQNLISSNPAAAKIYRRTDGQTTTLVSPSKRTPVDPLGARAKKFEIASTDGDKVFFTSSEQLTDDANTGPSRAGLDLYRYEISTDTLIDVSAESNTSDGARVQGTLGASDDGDWIYYAAQGEVLAGRGVQGRPNIYAWHDDGTADGSTRFIATLAPGSLNLFGSCTGDSSAADACNFAVDPQNHGSRVSPDGEAVIFHSTESLTGHPTNGFPQIYIYEVEAGNGDGALSCVSCRPDGGTSTAAALVSKTGFGAAGASADVDGETLSQPLSADGQAVFFDTTARLVSTDVNEVRDVYAWEAGRLDLVSPGQSNLPSQFSGASPDGDSVFFSTREPLVGQDYDEMSDIYVARVGGGLAYQNAPPPGEPCQGNECKPTPSPAPAPVPAPVTATFQSSGNYSPPFAVGKLGAKQLRSLARRGRIVLRIRVDQPGRVIVRALRGKRVMGAASKVLMRATTTNVVLRLRRPARRALAKQGRLNLRLEVRFAGESQTAKLRLRRANRNRGGAK